MFEGVWISMLCATMFGGVAEEPIWFSHDGEQSHVRADCLTPDHAIEFGRDTSDRLRDSITQAVFYADRLGIDPLVVIIDSDDHIGSQEFQVLRVGEVLGIEVEVISAEAALQAQYRLSRGAAEGM